jgi:hypothetical protein
MDSYKRILEEQGSEINSVVILPEGHELHENYGDTKVYFVKDKASCDFLYDMIGALHGRARSANSSFKINVIPPSKFDTKVAIGEMSVVSVSEDSDLDDEWSRNSESFANASRPESQFIVNSMPAHKTTSNLASKPVVEVFNVNYVNDCDSIVDVFIDGKRHQLLFEKSDRDKLIEAQSSYKSVRASIEFYKTISRGKSEITGGKVVDCKIFTVQGKLDL